jgi:ferredoxin-NADP reductase/Na+-transporting NADH:ubiquinone oxidoreductase subunit NqrB
VIPFVDSALNRITMYRLVAYYLLALLGIAALLSATGHLHFSVFAIAFSAGSLTIVCLVTNTIFARVFATPTNIESAYITALILALIISPLRPQDNIGFLAVAGVLAMASKYILAIRKQHIFNPAAIAVVLTALGAGQAASWWIGNSVMLPYVVIGGLLLTRKLQQFRLTLIFLVAAMVSTILLGLSAGHSLTDTHRLVLESPLFFFAFVMLSEPLTLPATSGGRAWYASLAGLLIPPQIHLGSTYSTPELTLVISNAFSYLISSRVKLLPRLQQKEAVAPDIIDFVFALPQPIKFKPGQYMEWTLPHTGADARGNRRYFTLASSPTEPNLRLGVKFYPKGSSYKRAMKELDAHSVVAAAQLGGDFVMPDDTTRKLAFIAGGIGITPFRSMIKYLVDTKQSRDVALLYSEKSIDELVYVSIFEQARKQLGTKTTYFVTDQDHSRKHPHFRQGFITAETIKAELPDYHERWFYISGSESMVAAMKSQLRQLGVPGRRIRTDYFSGYS